MPVGEARLAGDEADGARVLRRNQEVAQAQASEEHQCSCQRRAALHQQRRAEHERAEVDRRHPVGRGQRAAARAPRR